MRRLSRRRSFESRRSRRKHPANHHVLPVLAYETAGFTPVFRTWFSTEDLPQACVKSAGNRHFCRLVGHQADRWPAVIPRISRVPMAGVDRRVEVVAVCLCSSTRLSEGGRTRRMLRLLGGDQATSQQRLFPSGGAKARDDLLESLGHDGGTLVRNLAVARDGCLEDILEEGKIAK